MVSTNTVNSLRGWMSSALPIAPQVSAGLSHQLRGRCYAHSAISGIASSRDIACDWADCLDGSVSPVNAMCADGNPQWTHLCANVARDPKSGLPKRVFADETGAIDRAVVERKWSHDDIARIVEKD